MTATIACRDAFAPGRVAARLLFDHPFEHAGDERDAGRLDRLQVAGREQPRQRRRAGVLGGIRKHVGERADARQDARGTDRRDRIGEVQKRARRRRDRRQVDELVAAHAREHGTVDGRQEDTPDQRRVLTIGGQSMLRRSGVLA